MRIAWLISLYPPYIVGGNEMLARDLVEGLTARGHDVHVLTARGRDLPPSPAIHSVLNYDLEDKEAIFMGGRAPSVVEIYRRHVFDRSSYRQTLLALRQLRPELIVADNQYMASTAALVAAQRVGCPVVAQVADKWLRYLLWDLGMLLRPAGYLRQQAVRLYTRWIQPALRARAMPDQIIAISDFIKQNYVEAGFPAERIHALYLGVDTRLYPPRPGPHAGDNSLEIVFAGQLWEGKGPQILVAALGLLRRKHADLDLRLRIIGTGASAFREYLSREIRQNGLQDRVSLDGFVPLPRLAESLRRADLFVFPSTWDEPFSITLVAAMSSGAAVIATRTGGTPEALSDGVQGILVPANDVDALAGAVLRLARDPDLRNRLSRAAVARATRQWSFDAYVDRLERRYREIVSTNV